MAEVDVLAIGEPLMEMVLQRDAGQAGEIDGRLYRSVIGGDAFNATVAAARQGARAGFISALGDDPFGDDIRAFCALEGIDASALRTDPDHPTGAVYIDPDPVERRFFYARAGSAASCFSAADLPEDMIRAARALHLTGVTLAISKTMREAAYRAVRIAKEAGVLVSYDLNFRPKLWSLAEATEACAAILPMVDIVLPSQDDAEALTGQSDAEGILAYFSQYGPRAVLLKRGSDGVILRADGRDHHIPARQVEAVDSTGAGDCFAGAFLAHYLETGDALVAAEAACDVAAEAVTGWGATSAIPRR